MGRNKRSSSNRYESLSGRDFLVGYLSGMIVTETVTTKHCQLCFSNEIQGNEPPPHDYPKNYTVSSKAIETNTVLSLYENLFNDSNKKIDLSHIISNDKSTMIDIIKHVSNHPKCRLKDKIHQLEWYAILPTELKPLRNQS